MIGTLDDISLDKFRIPTPAVLYPVLVYTSKKNCNFKSDDKGWFNTKSKVSLIFTSDVPLIYLTECLFSVDALFGVELEIIFILKLQLEL